MAVLLMDLRYVPEDEVMEVRQLLDAAGFDYYETPPSFWGVSAGAIWLRNNDDKARATEVLARYQQARAENARAEYQRKLAAGEIDSFAQRLLRHPIRSLVLIAIILFVTWISVVPFFGV